MNLDFIKNNIKLSSIICGSIVFYILRAIDTFKLTGTFDIGHVLIVIFIGIFIMLSLKNDCKIKNLIKENQTSSDFFRNHGIIAVDKDNGKVVYVNKIACSILKKEKEDLIGKKLNDIPVCCLLTCDQNIKI